MPYSRRRPRVAAGGRLTVTLTPAQRDLFLHAADLPHALGHLLHRAPVRKGKLRIRAGREAVDTLIAVAALSPTPDRKAERSLNTFLRYLESLEDRFVDPPDEEDHARADDHVAPLDSSLCWRD